MSTEFRTAPTTGFATAPDITVPSPTSESGDSRQRFHFLPTTFATREFAAQYCFADFNTGLRSFKTVDILFTLSCLLCCEIIQVTNE
jgi:hypothetical protein